MKIFHGTENANISRPTVLTLGVFDGLHLGHQRIMQTVVERAEAMNAVPTVITFDPHPRAVLHPESAPPLLQTLDQRLANFEVLGIEQAIVIRFNREFAAIDAETFLRDVVYERLAGEGSLSRQRFRFRQKSRRKYRASAKNERGIRIFCRRSSRNSPARNAHFSSSKIRELLAEGKINLARRMLGRPYGVEGKIIHGARARADHRFSDGKSAPAQPRDSEIRRVCDGNFDR